MMEFENSKFELVNIFNLVVSVAGWQRNRFERLLRDLFPATVTKLVTRTVPAVRNLLTFCCNFY